MIDTATVRKATKQDLPQLVLLGLKLWPDNEYNDLFAEFESEMSDGTTFFIAEALDCSCVKHIGFAQCTLRNDYVEGTDSSPVGYLEGIYVDSPYRNKGISGRLLSCVEQWAREQGCSELGSDCELSNEASQQFHLHSGFTEANRIVCYTKHL